MNVSGARVCSRIELVSDAWDAVFFTMSAPRTKRSPSNRKAAVKKKCRRKDIVVLRGLYTVIYCWKSCL